MINLAVQKALSHFRSQAAFAEALGVTQGLVWQWLHGRRKVAPHHCRRIAELTQHAVTVHDLRPDIFGPAPTARAA